MQTVRIYQLKDLDQRTRARLRAAQLEAARVWMYCLERHRLARSERTRWPDRDDLQRETKGGQFALHSQSIQLVCQQFLANVETIGTLTNGGSFNTITLNPAAGQQVGLVAAGSGLLRGSNSTLFVRGDALGTPGGQRARAGIVPDGT